MNYKQFYRILMPVLIVVTLLRGGAPAAAQSSYDFSVPELRMQVYVRPDASVRIVYDITFENHSSFQPIDIVDIGTPHGGYDLGNFRASIDGQALSRIYVSEYIDTGVEIHLGDYEIEPGERGTLHVEFPMPDMVYQDTTDRDMASLQITPTWFDPSLVRGTTDLWVVVHLPEGIEPEEVLYQDEPFDQKAIFEGQTIVGWRWEQTRATEAHLVGVSFPKDVMDEVVSMNIFQLVNKWLKDNPGARFILGIINVAIFAFLFFRFSGGTGISVFVILTAMLIVLLVLIPWSVLLVPPLLLVLLFFNERNLKERRSKYLPPIAQVEGGGIKRGLTAPEAAIILELPLSKVLTLVIFGLLEKGILAQTQAEPLTVRVAEPFRMADDPTLNDHGKRARHRRAIAQQQGTVIHSYEHGFLDVIEKNSQRPLNELDFGKAMKTLIEGAAAKMKGFDLSDTQDYYRRVITRAWEQAESIGEIEKREEYIDRYLPWILMNEGRRPTVFSPGRGYTYWPRWMRYGPSIGQSGGGAKGGQGSGRAAPGGRTTLGDVGSSFAGWAEKTMGGMAGAILPSSLGGAPAAGGGFVDLSGVDRVTGDVFTALMESSSSGGGGGGGGCACACAGCACACACAGGGR